MAGSPSVNTLSPRQDGRHFRDGIFKCIFVNQNASIAIKISPKFVPKGTINSIPALVRTETTIELDPPIDFEWRYSLIGITIARDASGVSNSSIMRVNGK